MSTGDMTWGPALHGKDFRLSSSSQQHHYKSFTVLVETTLPPGLRDPYPTT